MESLYGKIEGDKNNLRLFIVIEVVKVLSLYYDCFVYFLYLHVLLYFCS